MLRMIFGVARTVGQAGRRITAVDLPSIATSHLRTYVSLRSTLQPLQSSLVNYNIIQAPITRTQFWRDGIIQPKILSLLQPPIRTVTKVSIRKGKRKTVKAAIKRFYRLAWGGWIRTRAGRFKHLWRKSPDQKYRYRQHVFCNATQCTLLDKMVTKYWKRRRYYVDDPYEPYHTREEYHATRRKPWPAPPF